MFSQKRQCFRRKLAENCDHNIDPRGQFFKTAANPTIFDFTATTPAL
jgi:hypothetical protein